MLYIPPNKELKQETIHLTTTTSLDCYYYKSEKEKLSKFIKQYYLEHKSYPDTQKNFYLYGRQIGHGAFGKVNIALHVASGRLVAIKSFNKKNLKKKNAKQKINNEIEKLKKSEETYHKTGKEMEYKIKQFVQNNIHCLEQIKQTEASRKKLKKKKKQLVTMNLII